MGEQLLSSVDEAAKLAAIAKTKVKATARGWSMLSQREILALAWMADVMLEDAVLPTGAPTRPEPPVISHL